MAESLESKLDPMMNTLVTLSYKITEIERLMARVHNDRASVTAQSKVHQCQGFIPEEAALPSVRQDPVTQQRKESRVSLPDKFDGTRSKFRAFVNQIRLITALHAERYATEE